MLKLTNSFYRSLWLNCDKFINRVQVKQFTNICCTRKKCPTVFSQEHLRAVAPETQLASIRFQSRDVKIYLHFKKSSVSNLKKKRKQMSESLKPTVNHVSYGGNFEIAPADDDPASQWRKFPVDESPCSGHQIPSNFRVWEPACRNYDKMGSSFKFKVVSYNVLAQCLLQYHPYLYKHCSPHDLKWQVRAPRLYDEIISLAPDIICLQEVQKTHLNTFYSKFEQIGYFGVFKQKTGQKEDGCAIYFKKAIFDLQDQIDVEFYQPKLPILNRDNIGLMVKLAPKACPDMSFVVATTHLLYNPKRTDVRLAQMQLFLAEIDRFAYYDHGRHKGHYPIILTGDLNSPPDSAVIELLDRGKVSAEAFRDNSDWRNIGVTDTCQHLSVYLARQRGDPVPKTCELMIASSKHNQQHYAEKLQHADDHYHMFNGSGLGHSLNLTSVYDRVRPSGLLEATTFQDEWLTVDYIYFSTYSTLRLKERLRLPVAQECEILRQLPNHVYASDHLALGAVFEIIPCDSRMLTVNA